MQLEILTREATSGSNHLVFIHGAWHAAWCWEEHFMEYFAEQGYTNHAPSLRGHGGSAGHDTLQAVRISDYVEDVISLTSTLEELPILIGHSMGGFIVQHFLATHRAKAVVLLASVPHTGALALNLRFLKTHPGQFLRSIIRQQSEIFIKEKNCIRDSFFPNLSPPQQAYYFQKMQAESFAAFWDMLLRPLPPVTSSQTPMLCLGATEDQVVCPEEVEQTAAAYNADLVIFPNMGHDMMLDRDWREVANTMLQWLQQQL
ncbi:alpha/beta fold hydrolase [Oscillatoria sp. CS-180]|uniref:alpha/beta hydrolase n=1 Tax=Oscillatoria sp. CS-180 TaxID=3021720 RepID=UPI00232DF6BA|nr:alpha/beta fold hydrolase [Oscillatoria sp. CS-180]MDB9526975.1 alpha/beta fold hydrolase [Oscillatoria sp. CS-180]